MGSSIDLRGRKKSHISYLRKNKHCNNHLQKSYNKHGEISFKWEVLEYINPTEDIAIVKTNLLEREQYHLNFYLQDSKVNHDLCYNTCPEAGSRLGSLQSEETKAKMRQVHLGNTYCLGNTHSEETRLKMSITTKNMGDSVKAKISKTLTGHEVSEETRNKISKAQIGKFVSEETRLKSSESHKGFQVSEETKDKIRKGNKGKIVSEETKAKMRESWKKRPNKKQ